MAVVMALVVPNLANSQQYPLMEQIANKVIAKYQNMSCAQLKQSKSTFRTRGRDDGKSSGAAQSQSSYA